MIEDFYFQSISGASNRHLLTERSDYLSFATRLGEVEIWSYRTYLHRWQVRLSALASWRTRRGWYLGSRVMSIHSAEYALVNASREYLIRGERTRLADTAWGKLGCEPADDPDEEDFVSDERRARHSDDDWPRIVARCVNGHFGVYAIEALTPIVLSEGRELTDTCTRCGGKVTVAPGVYSVSRDDHVHRRDTSGVTTDILYRPE